MNRPLDVAVRVHAYPPDHNAGAEWALHEMLRALAGRGHRTTVWLSTWSERSEPYDLDGVRVIPEAAGEDFRLAAARAHVLVSHLENVPLTADLARGYGVPLVVVCHNTFDLTWQPLTTGTTALAVVNSEWMAAEAEAAFKRASVRPDRVLIVRPPVHAVDYATKAGDCITLVNCTQTKGVGVLTALADQMPDRKFLAVRGGYGEQQPPELHNVLVLDHMNGRRMRDEVYARTRILLMPSDYESWGRVGVEAMASGIPVIAHPAEGLLESLADAGIFADRGHPEEWATAVEELDDPAAYRAASRKARARSKILDPAGDLAAWCEAVEEAGRVRAG
ncbi:glycosyltransferase family 4 protein [Streptomyces sp. NPDC056670]|uniref:glycosyltransferase family 4 protein n=1 Tax=Streptomyces sp. NPDC056670 TaxID=3345904 RepID=UPI0036B13CBE